MKPAEKLFLSDKFMLVLIMLNALLIFFQEFDWAPRWVDYADNFFTLIFAWEMLVKLRVYGSKAYWNNGWNRMDGILVILAVLSIVLQLFRFVDAETLQFLLTIRVLRVFKSFRLIRFVPNIQGIIAGVKRAAKSSYIVIMAFGLLLFISAIMTCALYKDIAPEYFNTPLDSMYTMFRIFSVEGWTEIPDLIASRSVPVLGILAKVYFVLLLFAGGILGMSLINSIFVDAMISPTSDKLEAKVEILTEKLEILISRTDPGVVDQLDEIDSRPDDGIIK